MKRELLLRKGLMHDLGYSSINEAAQGINYPDTTILGKALNREQPPNTALLTALSRAFPVLPLIYFTEVRT